MRGALAIVGITGAMASGCNPPANGPMAPLTVSVDCGDAGACPLVADAHTPITLSVCTPVGDDRKSPFDVTLVLSAGAWLNPADASKPAQTTVSLDNTSCATRTFIPTNVAGPLRVDALFGGFDIVQRLTLQPAPIFDLALSASPQSLPAMPSTPATTMITATVIVTNGGSPSAGTLLEFAVDATPAGSAVIAPTIVVIDPKSGGATATLTTAIVTTRATVSVTALPPSGDMHAAVTRTLDLHILPTM